MREGDIDETYGRQARIYSGARSILPSWAKKGAMIALAGLMLAFLGSFDASPYWTGFLQTTGSILTAAGLFMVMYSLLPE